MAKSNNELVNVRLPKAAPHEDNFVFVSVNYKTYKILRGVNVQVPRAVAEVLLSSDRAANEADSFITANKN